MNLLSQYIIASTHFYGEVSKEVIADIYDDQHDKQVTPEDFETCFRENRQVIEN